MKKLAWILVLLLLLTACASPVEPVTTTEAPLTEAPSTEQPTEAPSGRSETEAVTEPSESTSDFELAKTFIDKNLDDLKTALGEPADAYYEESCIGDGDDGILTYDTFTVFTFRPADGSAEVVVDAEPNN